MMGWPLFLVSFVLLVASRVPDLAASRAASIGAMRLAWALASSLTGSTGLSNLDRAPDRVRRSGRVATGGDSFDELPGRSSRGGQDRPGSRQVLILNEEERSQQARYEAFLALASEMIAPGTISQVAKVMVARFKYVTDVFAWRYLSLEAIGANAQEDGAEAFAIDGLQSEGVATPGGAIELSSFERDVWNEGKAVMLDVEELAALQDTLPALFRNPEITRLYVVPQWGRDRLEALFFTCTHGPVFDKFDIKFIGLTSLFFHRKVAYLRMEKRMTDDLIETLNRLRQTQDDMIEAEKLAALGAMVAGVSHELNTPISNALIVSSTLSEHLNDFARLLATPGLKKSDLVGWQKGALEMGQLIDSSLQRACSLIASFKQVSIDQTSERRRSFDLRGCVEDILAALRAGYKGAPWVLENQIPEGIECDTFPGPFGQVVTNLVQNAVVHGFEGRDRGRVVLTASLSGAHVSVIVTDDGVGMSGSVLAKVFEPFF
ncbi:sensor histidine kinase, partial [Pelomonas sp. KK5]|uniref:sensor histidine kinase n=1 Tax=Pelomonas sp. KK5 TaxID=1855730 RepID=UPI0018E966AB